MEVISDETPHLINVPSIMQALDSSRSTVYELISSGKLRTVTVGRRRFTTRRFLTEYIAALEDVADGPGAA